MKPRTKTARTLAKIIVSVFHACLRTNVSRHMSLSRAPALQREKLKGNENKKNVKLKILHLSNAQFLDLMI